MYLHSLKKNFMMKSLLLGVLSTLLIVFSSSAQMLLQSTPVVKCYTVEHMEELRKAKPNAETDQQFEQWLNGLVQQAMQRTNAAYNLPVVFHIVHNGEAEGTGLNVATALIQSQLHQINKDFQNKAGSPYAVTATTDVRFSMAQKDPVGADLPTPGIDRIDRIVRGYNDPGTAGWSSSYINSTIKPNTIWDPLRYINIWIMPISGNILGYATFPTSSGLPGLFAGEDNTNAGVVITSSSVGSVVTPGSGTCTNVYNLGRTLTHELGHFLGLRHIWGDTNCGDDFVGDTPIHQTSNYGEPTHPKPNTCGTIDEMFENYMDYADDKIAHTFTAGQVSRIQAVMLNSPRRKELATSNVGLVSITSNKVSFTACGTTPSILEKGNNGSFPWTKDVPVILNVENVATGAATVTVNVGGTAINGTDYQLMTPTLTFASGDAFKTIIIRINDDAIPEATKTITINYTISGSGITAAPINQSLNITLIDDDQVRPGENPITILSEGFETPSATLPAGWSSLIGSGSPNSFVVSANGNAGGTGQVAHITNNTATKPNTYTKITTGLAVIRTPLLDANGLTDINMQFKYTVAGEIGVSTPFDYAYPSFSTEAAPTSFQQVAGSALLVSNTPLTGVANSTIPSSFNNTRFHLGVLWRNDNADGNDPGINVDDVLITALGTRIETALNSSNSFSVAPSTINQFKSSQNSKIMATITNVSANIPQLTVSIVEAGNDRPTITTQTGTYLRTRKVFQVTPPGNDNTTTYNATFFFTPTELAAWGGNVNNLRILKVSNTANLGGTLSSNDGVVVTPTVVNRLTTDGYVSFSANFTGFSKFTIVEQATILPVRLLDFKGVLSGNIVKLNWKTTAETNNRGFDIERSTDGITFGKIGFVSALNGSVVNNYNFDDVQIIKGNRYYYRLKQIDNDSRSSYSPVVNITYLDKEQFTWYPNPVKNKLVIQNNGVAKNASVSITDLGGRSIYKSQMLSSGNLEISTSTWASGVYTVVLTSDGEPITFKVVKD